MFILLNTVLETCWPEFLHKAFLLHVKQELYHFYSMFMEHQHLFGDLGIIC